MKYTTLIFTLVVSLLTAGRLLSVLIILLQSITKWYLIYRIEPRTSRTCNRWCCSNFRRFPLHCFGCPRWYFRTSMRWIYLQWRMDRHNCFLCRRVNIIIFVWYYLYKTNNIWLLASYLPSELSVTVGQVSLISEDPDEVNYPIYRLFVFDGYDSTAKLHDIALLQVRMAIDKSVTNKLLLYGLYRRLPKWLLVQTSIWFITMNQQKQHPTLESLPDGEAQW